MNARKLATTLLFIATASGCFSTTRIYSRPVAANVVIDNKRALGQTPIELQEQVWVWTRHSLTLEAEGYQPRVLQLRSTGVNWGYAVACICTAGLALPLGVLSSYPATYVVDLVPLTPEAPQGALQESAAVTFR